MKYKILFFIIVSIFTSNVFANFPSEIECAYQRSRIKEFYERCEEQHALYTWTSFYYKKFYSSAGFSLTCNGINPTCGWGCEGEVIFASDWFNLKCAGANWGAGSAAASAGGGGGGSAGGGGDGDGPRCPIENTGSIIQTSNQVIGETIPLTGTSFNLTYYSNKVFGKRSDYTSAPLYITPTYILPEILGYNLKVKNEVGALVYSDTYTAVPNIVYQYEWNGLDASSVETWGPIERTIAIEESATDFQVGEIPSTFFLGSLKAKKLGLGAWLPNIWHFYHAPSKRLYRGDGNFRTVTGVSDGSYTRIADEGGKEVYYFDSTGKIVFTKLGLTGTTIYTFGYNSSGQLINIAEPFSKITTFNRLTNGNITSITAPNGKVTTLSLDTNGYLSQVKNPLNETYDMSYYGTGGLLHTFTAPSGDVTTLTYDIKGNLVSDTHSNGLSSTLSKTSSGVETTSALGRITSNSLDSTLSVETQIKPSGYQHSFASYDGYKETISPDLYETTYFQADPRFGDQSIILSSLDSHNFGQRTSSFTNTTTLTNPADPFSIDSIINIETIGPSINTSTYTGSNRTTINSSKLGKTFKVQIDQYERPILTQIGNLTSKVFTYTNELLTKITQGTREQNLAYNTSGLLSSVTNSLGQVTSFTYDNAERLKTTTLPDLRVINYTYDYNANLTSITPPFRNEHKLIYGLNDKLEEYQPPLLSGVTTVNTSYTYNDDKQLTKITRPDGEEIDYVYDSVTGLLSSIEGTFGVITTSHESEKISAITDQYDHNLSINYTRSVASNVNLDKSGTGIYNYSRTPYAPVGGKLGSETIHGLGTSSVQRVVNYTYNDDEDLTAAGTLQLAYNSPNGQLTGTTLSNVKDYYTYNSFGEISTYQVKYLTNVIYEYTLTRDAIGRVSQKIEKLNGVTKTFDYGYDTAGRLVEVQTNGVVTSTYTYDGNSNRTGGVIRGESTSATYDGQDRLTSYNSVAHTYNANGEILTKGTANFNYDVFGNLKTYVKGTTSVTYEIDPLQRRFGTIVGTTLSSRFVYNPEGQVVGQLNNLNKLQKTFVYASKRHVPDYYIDASNNKFKIVTDYLGSVRLVVSTSGVVSEIMEHDEFGRVLQDTNPGVIPFGFAGGLYDHRTGLVRFGARDYDSHVGRWLGKDPILFAAGDPNLYGYVMSDPINAIDPSGLSSSMPGMGNVGSAEYCTAMGEIDRKNLTDKIRSYDQQLSVLNGQISSVNSGGRGGSGGSGGGEMCPSDKKNLLKLQIEQARISTLRGIAIASLTATNFSAANCAIIGRGLDLLGISPVSY